MLGQLWFAACGCFFLLEAGSKKAESFSFSSVSTACSPPDESSLLTLSGTAAASLLSLLGLPERAVVEYCCLQVVLVQFLATALSRFHNILLNSLMK